MKVLIIIPAYNASRSIADVIRKTLTAMQAAGYAYQVMVVDDGSKDDTGSRAAGFGIRTVRHVRNLGKGAALKTGFAAALLEAYDWIVTLDADLQHNPEHIGPMLDMAVKGHFDIVIGSRRFEPARMSLARRFSNTTTTWLISKRIGQRIKDSQSGFRVIRTAILAGVTLTTNRYETESEFLMQTGRHARIGAFPIDTVYGDETSHIRHWLDTWRFVRMYCRFLRK